ncbi:unnamed protein product [Rhizophagus irregularis]|nr:unnamed protein product [Rhizophagus irregularis]
MLGFLKEINCCQLALFLALANIIEVPKIRWQKWSCHYILIINMTIIIRALVNSLNQKINVSLNFYG